MALPEVVFISSLASVVYVYLGYPLLLAIVSRFLRRVDPSIDNSYLPSVSLIISAYNEQKIIAKKLRNTLTLDYPHDKLEIIVLSDGSTDKTDEIVKEFESEGVRLVSLEDRKGKTYCQNLGVELTQNDILVFSDANGLYQEDTIRKLVRHFADSSVGAVSGEAHYTNPQDTVAGHAEGLYLRYEHAVKQMESRVVSVAGASGPVYAVARKAYVPLTADLISDFLEPILVFRSGYKVQYEPAAISVEEAANDLRIEFSRKRRIVNRAWRGLWSVKELLNPLKYGLFAVQLVSHKLFRWLVPVALIAMLSSNLFCLEQAWCRVALLLQLAFYLAAAIGYKWQNLPLYPVTYFCLVNSASLLGIFDAVVGRHRVTWETER